MPMRDADPVVDQHESFARGRGCLLVATISSLCLVPNGFLGLNLYDEGLVVYGAQRVLEGDVPYRDFWTLYAPGQFYVLALLFKLFGPSLIVERLYSSMVCVLTSLCAYGLATRLVPPRWAWVSALLTVASLSTLSFSYPVAPALLCTLVSCTLLVHFLEQGKCIYLVGSGIATGATTLFRHDFGFYSFLAETFIILCFSWFAEERDAPTRRAGLQGALPNLGWFFGAVLAVLLPVAVVLFSSTPWRTVFSDLVEFPATVYPRVRALPVPALLPDPALFLEGGYPPARYLLNFLGRLALYFAPIVFLISFVALIHRLVHQSRFRTEDWLRCLLLLIGLAYLNHAKIRTDLPHVVSATVPATILFSSIIFGSLVGPAHARSHYVRVFSASCYAMLALSVCLPLLWRGQLLVTWLAPRADLVALNLPRARGIYVHRDLADALEDGIRCVQEIVPAQADIFVGKGRHDRMVGNDILLYFLAERRCPTRYHELHPGLADTREAQQEIIKALKVHDVRCVVIEDDEHAPLEPNGSSESSGVMDLDNYILENYAVTHDLGRYKILERRKSVSE